jgi:hypothetical protein
MKNIFLLFSHKLTNEQIIDAKKVLKVDNFVYLPKNLQSLWSNIPAELESLKNYLLPLKEYIKNNTKEDDYILIQGDFGAVYEMVEYAKKLNLISVYATTKRETQEEIQKEKVVKISKFKHIRYRKY